LSVANPHLASRAAELRAEFDLSFAASHQLGRVKGDGFLEIKVGDGVFALRLSEVAGLSSNRKVTPIPGPAPALLGVASFRGAITPVYSLEAFFEKPIDRQARWLVISAAAQVAFAFTGLIGHLERPADDARPAAPGQQAQKFTGHFLPIGDHLRPIVDLAAIIAEIRVFSKSMP